MIETKTINTGLPNELDFVDADIKKEFEGKNYIVGTPTSVQLARNIKKLNDNLEQYFKTVSK